MRASGRTMPAWHGPWIVSRRREGFYGAYGYAEHPPRNLDPARRSPRPERPNVRQYTRWTCMPARGGHFRPALEAPEKLLARRNSVRSPSASTHRPRSLHLGAPNSVNADRFFALAPSQAVPFRVSGPLPPWKERPGGSTTPQLSAAAEGPDGPLSRRFPFRYSSLERPAADGRSWRGRNGPKPTATHCPLSGVRTEHARRPSPTLPIFDPPTRKVENGSSSATKPLALIVMPPGPAKELIKRPGTGTDTHSLRI